jgi:hypothetical protein
MKNAIQSINRMPATPSWQILRASESWQLYGIPVPSPSADSGLARPSLWTTGMSLCASCGLQLSGEAGLCPHHHCVYGDDWAVANRIMCDFFHRQKVPPRLGQTERDDDFWAHTGEAA